MSEDALISAIIVQLITGPIWIAYARFVLGWKPRK